MSRHRFLLLVPLTLACQEGPPPAEVPPLDPGPWDLVFHSERSGGGDVLRWWSDGDSVRVLAGGPGVQHGPRWDRSRHRLTWLEDGPGGAVLHALGDGGLRVLGPNPGTEESVAWSPDGRWRLFSARVGETFDLFLQPADGGAEPTPLTDGRGNDRQPTWSPDGRTLAFTSDRDGSPDLWTMPAKGGRPRNRSATPHLSEGHPAWSPDGRFLVFDAAGPDGDADLFVLQVDTGVRRRLVGAPGPDLVPAWSPDGEWIAYGSARHGDWEIRRVRPDGTEDRRLTRSPGFDGNPRWVPARWAPAPGG